MFNIVTDSARVIQVLITWLIPFLPLIDITVAEASLQWPTMKVHIVASLLTKAHVACLATKVRVLLRAALTRARATENRPAHLTQAHAAHMGGCLEGRQMRLCSGARA